MNAPITIRVTSRALRIVKSFHRTHPGILARLAHRYRAEFTAGPFAGLAADGFENADEAVGSLVRTAARSLADADQVLDLLARIQDTLEVRGADEALGRTIRFASRARERKHAGVKITFEHPENQPPTSPTAAARPEPAAAPTLKMTRLHAAAHKHRGSAAGKGGAA